jgi:hypothetical protein
LHAAVVAEIVMSHLAGGEEDQEVIGLGTVSQKKRGGDGPGLSPVENGKEGEGQKEQSSSGSHLSHLGLWHDFLSGDSQKRPHGMRGSGLSPFIFAMRVGPFLAKGER